MSDKKFCLWEDAVLWLKSQPDRAEQVRVSYFDDPLTAAAERFAQSAEWQAVTQLLPAAKGKALDLGAGRGISSYALAKEGWDVTALEPDPSPVVGAGAIRALSQESGLTIHVVEKSGESLPFADASFDLVYGRQVMHHARNLGAFCAEAFRVLKPLGVFVATREHVISRRSDLEVFLNSHPLHALYGGEHAYLFEEYLNAIRVSGLEVVRVLNSMASDINLHPNTRSSIKKKIGGRLLLPIGGLIPDWLLALIGHLDTRPGRLYSFVAAKPAQEIPR